MVGARPLPAPAHRVTISSGRLSPLIERDLPEVRIRCRSRPALQYLHWASQVRACVRASVYIHTYAHRQSEGRTAATKSGARMADWKITPRWAHSTVIRFCMQATESRWSPHVFGMCARSASALPHGCRLWPEQSIRFLLTSDPITSAETQANDSLHRVSGYAMMGGSN